MGGYCNIFGLTVNELSLCRFPLSAGVSVTSSNTGVPDISGSVYTKTQVTTEIFTHRICFCLSCSSKQKNTIVAQLIILLPGPLQSFEKQGFHAGTPAASFSLPSALGSGGPINPPAAAGYAPAPFMHILTPHQQPHSQILHHHLQQDGQVQCVYINAYVFEIM